nr:hypothetical protein GCM10017547_36860 [Pseudarthrobacter oxydans]
MARRGTRGRGLQAQKQLQARKHTRMCPGWWQWALQGWKTRDIPSPVLAGQVQRVWISAGSLRGTPCQFPSLCFFEVHSVKVTQCGRSGVECRCSMRVVKSAAERRLKGRMPGRPLTVAGRAFGQYPPWVPDSGNSMRGSSSS